MNKHISPAILEQQLSDARAEISALHVALNDAVGWILANPGRSESEEQFRTETLERVGKIQRAYGDRAALTAKG